MTDEERKLRDAVHAMDRSVQALALELHRDVWSHVNRTWHGVRDALPAQKDGKDVVPRASDVLHRVIVANGWLGRDHTDELAQALAEAGLLGR